MAPDDYQHDIPTDPPLVEEVQGTSHYEEMENNIIDDGDLLNSEIFDDDYLEDDTLQDGFEMKENVDHDDYQHDIPTDPPLVEEIQGTSHYEEMEDTINIDDGDFLNSEIFGDDYFGDDTLQDGFEMNVDYDEKKPLYDGATITVGAVMLLLALFVTKHSIVGDGVQQLLNILALTLPSGHQLCTSLQSFKTYFKNLKNPLVKHFYCGYCLGYVQDKTVKVCPYSKCKKPLSQKMDYFLEMPVKSQIKNLLSQNDFYSNLQGRFSSQKSNVYSDIYDGKLYKSYFDFSGPLSCPDNISFTFNTDGAAVFKSSNVSVWPLFMVINELPYNIRMKKENMILTGLWFGKQKPSMGTYLKPFLDTFKELEDGITLYSPDKNTDFLLKGYLLCGTADLPARCLLCNSIQFNGSYSCWKCVQKGESALVRKGYAHVFPFNCEQPKGPIRTKESVLCDAQKALDLQDSGDKTHSVNGVKGPSWLNFFPKFDIVNGIAIDYMHGVLLGVQKLLLNLWFGVSHKSKPFSYYNKVGLADERLLNIKPTSSVSRLPRSIENDLKYWKASEYRSFLLYYGAPILNGILDEDKFSHYLLFANAIYILLMSGSTDIDVTRAEIMLFEFVNLFAQLYDNCFMTLNIHQLVHLADSVRYLGPLFTHSCFAFEDKNGVLLKMIRGTQNIDCQIITGVSFLQRLPELKQSTVTKGSDIEKLCHSIENSNILIRGLKLGKHIYVLGAIKMKVLTDLEHNVVCRCLGYNPALRQYKYFKRLEFHDFLIYGTSYSRMIKRDNSTISYKENDALLFAKVIYFLIVDKDGKEYVLAVVNELECKHYNASSNILLVKELDKLKAIPLECIVESCIHVVVKDDPGVSYVCRFPNCLESD